MTREREGKHICLNIRLLRLLYLRLLLAKHEPMGIVRSLVVIVAVAVVRVAVTLASVTPVCGSTSVAVVEVHSCTSCNSSGRSGRGLRVAL